MNSYTQLFLLIFSFFYGKFVYLGNRFNLFVIEKKNILIKSILSVLYVFNISLLYVVILYKINNGILNIYFIIAIILGYFINFVKKCKL